MHALRPMCVKPRSQSHLVQENDKLKNVYNVKRNAVGVFVSNHGKQLYVSRLWLQTAAFANRLSSLIIQIKS